MKNLVFILFMALATACQPKLSDQALLRQKTDAFDTQIKKAAETEAAFNPKLAQDAVDAFQFYVFQYPADSASANYLFKAADLMKNLGEPQTVVSTYAQIIENYPKFDKIDACYFLKADAYHNILKDYPKAAEAYELYVEKFPNSGFVKDAKTLIEACKKGMTTEVYFEKEVLNKTK